VQTQGWRRRDERNVNDVCMRREERRREESVSEGSEYRTSCYKKKSSSVRHDNQRGSARAPGSCAPQMAVPSYPFTSFAWTGGGEGGEEGRGGGGQSISQSCADIRFIPALLDISSPASLDQLWSELTRERERERERAAPQTPQPSIRNASSHSHLERLSGSAMTRPDRQYSGSCARAAASPRRNLPESPEWRSRSRTTACPHR